MQLAYSAICIRIPQMLLSIMSSTILLALQNSQWFPQQPQDNTNSSQQCKALGCFKSYLSKEEFLLSACARCNAPMQLAEICIPTITVTPTDP